MNISNTENFIKKAQAIHGNIYSYENVFYEHAHFPVKILCKIHGLFEQKPKVHLLEAGCPECNKDKRQSQALATRSIRQKEFLRKAKEIHGDLYDYSKVDYINSTSDIPPPEGRGFTDLVGKILIICKKHGNFLQTPGNHVYNGRGCPDCGVEKAIKVGSANPACSTDLFIKKQ